MEEMSEFILGLHWNIEWKILQVVVLFIIAREIDTRILEKKIF